MKTLFKYYVEGPFVDFAYADKLLGNTKTAAKNAAECVFLEAPEEKIVCTVVLVGNRVDFEVALDDAFYNKHVGRFVPEAQSKETARFLLTLSKNLWPLPGSRQKSQE